MCLHERDVTLLSIVLAIQLAQICFLGATPEGRAALAGLRPRSFRKPLVRALVLALPAAALIKLFHDWVDSAGRSVCMGRTVYLLGCFLLCAALELQWFASKLVDTGSDLDLSTRYPARRWGLLILFVAVCIGLLDHVAFR